MKNNEYPQKDSSRYEQNDSRYRISNKREPESSMSSLSTLTGDGTEVKLKKRLGIVSGISLIVGTMIGSGIFISPKGVLEGSGSVGLTLVSWTICGVISLFGALCYAELGTLIPKSGSTYIYLKYAFGDLVSFMFAWINIVVLRTTSMATVCLTCGEYVAVAMFADDCPAPQSIVRLVAAFVLVLITGVNCYSVKLAARVQVIFTASKILALVIISVGGIVRLGQGYTETLSTGFSGSETNIGVIAIGLYSGLWAYDGWNTFNAVTEEVINPEKVLPRSIMIAVPMVTILYLTVNISYFTAMSIPQLLESPAVAMTWSDVVISEISWIMPIFVALSTFGSANGSLFTSGRNLYVNAKEGHMIQVLAMIHVKNYTPLPSLLFTCFTGLIIINLGDISSLIDIFSFTGWLFTGLTMVGLLVLRVTRKDDPRPYKVPIVLPVIMVFVSIYLVVAPIVNDPRLAYIYGVMFILAGFIFYIPFVHFKKSLPGMDGFTVVMQQLMEVSLPPKDI